MRQGRKRGEGPGKGEGFDLATNSGTNLSSIYCAILKHRYIIIMGVEITS